MMATSYRKSKFDETQLIALADKLMPFLKRLPSGMTLITENLFDHAEWQSMSRSERQKMGEMLAVLVKHEIFPLAFLDTTFSVKRYLKTAS